MKVSFVGDVSFTGKFGEVVRDPNLQNNIFAPEVLEKFKDSDYTVCNLEGPLTERECVLSTKLNVKSPKESLPFLLESHFNVFGLANNHMFDAQYGGFKDTIDLLDENNALYLGAGDNLDQASSIVYLENEDITISVIAVGHNHGEVADKNSFGIFSYAQEETLRARILVAKSKSDWVVLFYHTGPEYNYFPTPTVRNRLISTLDMGADIIVAHHPHVMQGIEYFENNKVIVYSLGNFIFDLVSMRQKGDHDIGLISTFEFQKDSYKINNVPVKIDPIAANVSLADQSYSDKFIRLSSFTDYRKKVMKDSFRVLLANPLLPNKFGLKFILFILGLPIIFVLKMYLAKGAAREFTDYVFEYFNVPFVKRFFPKDEKYKTL